MTDGLVRDRELSEVETDHLGLDLDLVEDLAVVDADDATDHLGHDDHVAQVSLDDLGLLAGGRRRLGLAELLHQAEGLALESALETTASARVNELGERGRVEVEELRELFFGKAWGSVRETLLYKGGKRGLPRLHGRRTCGRCGHGGARQQLRRRSY